METRWNSPDELFVTLESTPDYTASLSQVINCQSTAVEVQRWNITGSDEPMRCTLAC